MQGKATFVVGLQYGDEGKGKIVDYLAEKSDIVVRANGGSNAGHTIVLQTGKPLALHQIPSGIAYENTLNIIGHGCFVDSVRLMEEIEDAKDQGIQISPANLLISKSAHLVLPIHKKKDEQRESGNKAQGSTKAGIAFAASDKALREGLRAEVISQKSERELTDIADSEFAKSAKALEPFLSDSVTVIQQQLSGGKSVLLEGAQAFGLDINFGKYPYTTSSDTTVAGLMSGSGVNYKQVGKVIGVAKAIPSKVGSGAFVTKITDKKIAKDSVGEKGKVDSEFGATTGREREVGYLDLVALKRAIEVNGVDEIALTKFDCLKRHGKTTKVAVAYNFNGQSISSPPASNEELSKCEPIYEELPTWEDDNSVEAENYLKFLEEYLGILVTLVGNGPNRNQLILRQKS